MNFDVPPSGRIRCGRLAAYLYRDLFTVQLDDGIKITAVMPAELLPIYNPNVKLHRTKWIEVEVEMREPPALPKIINAYRVGFCGSGY